MSKSSPSVLEWMQAIGFLPELSREDLEKVARLATVVEATPGTVLFREGDVADQISLVTKGIVALDMNVPRRGPVRILTVGPGEIIGWSPLFSLDQKMTASATVVSEAVLVSIPGRQLAELCEADSDVGYAVMRRMAMGLAQRLLATRLQLLDLFSETQPAATWMQFEP